MINFPIPILGFVAFSGTGKTTLLSKIIPPLKTKGYRIAVIKHSHHIIEFDKPGKDSYVLRESGADQIVVSSKNRTAVFIEEPDKKEPPQIEDVISQVDTDTLDLIIVEGFKNADIKKIELNRESLGNPYFFTEDENIIAIATDHKIPDGVSIPQLNLNHPQQIAKYIENNWLLNKPHFD